MHQTAVMGDKSILVSTLFPVLHLYNSVGHPTGHHGKNMKSHGPVQLPSFKMAPSSSQKRLCSSSNWHTNRDPLHLGGTVLAVLVLKSSVLVSYEILLRMPNVPEFFQVIKFISDSAHENADCPMVRELLQD